MEYLDYDDLLMNKFKLNFLIIELLEVKNDKEKLKEKVDKYDFNYIYLRFLKGFKYGEKLMVNEDMKDYLRSCDDRLELLFKNRLKMICEVMFDNKFEVNENLKLNGDFYKFFDESVIEMLISFKDRFDKKKNFEKFWDEWKYCFEDKVYDWELRWYDFLGNDEIEIDKLIYKNIKVGVNEFIKRWCEIEFNIDFDIKID